MKDKILYLVLGILIGAIITAGSFMLFSNNDKGRGGPGGEMPSGNFVKGDRPEMDGMGDASGNTTNSNNI